MIQPCKENITLLHSNINCGNQLTELNMTSHELLVLKPNPTPLAAEQHTRICKRIAAS
jgi:hypothetical protein